MKKVIALVLALVMTAALLCTPVFAAGSKSEPVETVVAAPAAVEEVKVTVTDTKVAEITADEMKAAAPEAGELNVIAQKDFEAEKLPVTITIVADGTENATLYVFFKAVDAQDWTMVWTGKGPEAKVTFTANGTYAVAVEAAA